MAEITPLDARNLLSRIVDRLAGPHGDKWLEALITLVQRGEQELGNIPPIDHCVWMRVKLGLYATPQEYLDALTADQRCKVLKPAERLLLETVICGSGEIQLVIRSLAQLGLCAERPFGFVKTNYRHICSRAEELGLYRVPREIAPIVILSKKADEITTDRLFIASEPLSERHLGVFRIRRERRRLWLMRSDMDRDWLEKTQFIFATTQTI